MASYPGFCGHMLVYEFTLSTVSEGVSSWPQTPNGPWYCHWWCVLVHHTTHYLPMMSPAHSGCLPFEVFQVYGRARDQHVGSRTNKQFWGSIVILPLTQWHPTLIAVLTQTVSLHWPTSCCPANHLNTLVSDEKKSHCYISSNDFSSNKFKHDRLSHLRLYEANYKCCCDKKKCFICTKSASKVTRMLYWSLHFYWWPYWPGQHCYLFHTCTSEHTPPLCCGHWCLQTRVYSYIERVWWMLLYDNGVLFLLK